MGSLDGGERDRHVAHIEIAAAVRKPIGLHGLENNLSRLAVAVLCLFSRNTEKRKFHRGPSANTKIESAATELIKHADLFESAQGMIQIQQHHQRSKPEPFGPLSHGRQEQVRGSRHAMWRAMMLCDVISEKASFVARRRDFQSIAVLLAQTPAGVIQMIKN